MHRASDYDRILISIAVAVLGAALLAKPSRAQESQPLPMLDRYGGEIRPAPQRAPVLRGRLPYAPPITAPTPMAGGLSWSGKAYAASAPMVYAPAPQAPAAYAPAYPAAALYAPARSAFAEGRRSHGRRERRREAARLAAAPRPLAPAPQEEASPEPAPLAAAAPPPAPARAVAMQPAPVQAARSAPAPVAAQQYQSGAVRHYSVHREFGMRPDPTPIPPQFFTATADLSGSDSADAAPIPRTPPAQAAHSGTGRGRIAAQPTAADPS